jgi:hypothetical protein
MKVPLEIDEQKAYIDWLKLNKVDYFAVPNQQKLAKTIASNKIRVIKFYQSLKKEGYKKGAPDLICLFPKELVCVEMKRQKGSTISQEQKQWNEKINSYPYSKAFICKGAEDAISKTREFL